MMILTSEQADQVRGVSVPGHALEPVPLIDGTFVLPEACAADPNHAKHHALMALLPTREVGEEEYFHDALEAYLTGVGAI